MTAAPERQPWLDAFMNGWRHHEIATKSERLADEFLVHVAIAAYADAFPPPPRHEITEDGCTCGWENPIPWGTGEWQEPCVEGHFDCAKVEGGRCAMEYWHATYQRHLDEVGADEQV